MTSTAYLGDSNTPPSTRMLGRIVSCDFLNPPLLDSYEGFFLSISQIGLTFNDIKTLIITQLMSSTKTLETHNNFRVTLLFSFFTQYLKFFYQKKFLIEKVKFSFLSPQKEFYKFVKNLEGN